MELILGVRLNAGGSGDEDENDGSGRGGGGGGEKKEGIMRPPDKKGAVLCVGVLGDITLGSGSVIQQQQQQCTSVHYQAGLWRADESLVLTFC